jgi:hypothetical protein
LEKRVYSAIEETETKPVYNDSVSGFEHTSHVKKYKLTLTTRKTAIKTLIANFETNLTKKTSQQLLQ